MSNKYRREKGLRRLSARKAEQLNAALFDSGGPLHSQTTNTQYILGRSVTPDVPAMQTSSSPLANEFSENANFARPSFNIAEYMEMVSKLRNARKTVKMLEAELDNLTAALVAENALLKSNLTNVQVTEHTTANLISSSSEVSPQIRTLTRMVSSSTETEDEEYVDELGDPHCLSTESVIWRGVISGAPDADILARKKKRQDHQR